MTRTISWIDDAGRLAEVDLSDDDAAKLRAGSSVAAYSTTPVRRYEPDHARDRVGRQIAELEHRQVEIRAELDDLVDRYPEAKAR